MQRRQFIKMMGASLAVWQTGGVSAPISAALNASSPVIKNAGSPKIVWLVLRGAMDSLHGVVPTFETELATLRPSLYEAIHTKLLPLERGFALHPSFANLHRWYQQKQFLPIVAVGTGYGARSHFDGQDFLESGSAKMSHESGWLGRAIAIKHKKALAVAQSTPISLRQKDNKAVVTTWYPTNLKNADNDIYHTLTEMYATEPLLSQRLAEGGEMKAMVGMEAMKVKKGNLINLAKSCAKLMTEQSGIDCAMLEMGGWDTHNNQAGRLARQFTELDSGLAALKGGLAEQWKNTVVIVATEFGRTVHENGTQGTDHGTGSVMFLAGGALKQSAILGKWPGLSKDKLFQQRDLQPTTETFSWFATVLKQHWHFTEQELNEVFPENKPYSDELIG